MARTGGNGGGALALAAEAIEASAEEELRADRRSAAAIARRDRIAADVAMFTVAAGHTNPTTEVTTR